MHRIVFALLLCTLPTIASKAQPITRHFFTDPFSYCKAVRNADTIDDRYGGPLRPKEFLAAFDLTESSGMLEWRCMGGNVYACGSGNDPVCGKETPYTRIYDIRQFCAANPDSAIVPIAVKGHFPANWTCKGGQPVLGQGDFRIDKRGYPVVYWKLMWDQR